MRHTGREVAEDVVDGDPHPTDAWLPASRIRVYGDAFLVTHVTSLRRETRRFKERMVDASAT